MLVLPLSADSDRNSPVWVVRLGDITMLSKEIDANSSVVEYEYYNVNIDSMRLQYYSSYHSWVTNLSHLSNLRERSVTQRSISSDLFSVIEDSTLKLTIGIKQKKAGQLMLA